MSFHIDVAAFRHHQSKNNHIIIHILFRFHFLKASVNCETKNLNCEGKNPRPKSHQAEHLTGFAEVLTVSRWRCRSRLLYLCFALQTLPAASHRKFFFSFLKCNQYNNHHLRGMVMRTQDKWRE